MNTASTYAAALTLDRRSWLAEYSKRILGVAVMLEKQLIARGVPAVQRNTNAPPTHHVWIREASKGAAFEKYEALKACRILTNFRLLPYSRSDTDFGSVLVPRCLGLTDEDVPELAELIAGIRIFVGISALRIRAREFNESLWARS